MPFHWCSPSLRSQCNVKSFKKKKPFFLSAGASGAPVGTVRTPTHTSHTHVSGNHLQTAMQTCINVNETQRRSAGEGRRWIWMPLRMTADEFIYETLQINWVTLCCDRICLLQNTQTLKRQWWWVRYVLLKQPEVVLAHRGSPLRYLGPFLAFQIWIYSSFG